MFWPSKPHPYSVVYRVFHSLGVTIKKGLPNSEKSELGFLWHDATFVAPPPVNGLINGSCLDISKKKVDSLHKEVFGYACTIDPLVYKGLIVIKSDLNGEHDGVVVQAPLSDISPEFVYQLVIDNRPLDGSTDMVCDLRVVVFCGKPEFVYVKLRAKAERFSNTNASTTIVDDVAMLFTSDELLNIEAFCNAAGFDCGEIDIIRDWHTKKIYILDINKTPLGPANGLCKADFQYAMELYIKYFNALILKHVA